MCTPAVDDDSRRLIRIETKLTRLLVKLGMDPDGHDVSSHQPPTSPPGSLLADKMNRLMPSTKRPA